MITLEENMSVKDIRQWLGDGWFLYRPKKYPGMVAAHVTEWPDYSHPALNPETAYINIRLSSGHNEIRPIIELQECVFPHWPTLGSLNIEGFKFALNLKRTQQKQWCRTYNSRQIMTEVPRRKELFKLFRKPPAFAPHVPDVVRAAFFPVYPTIEEAHNYFNTGWASVALTPTLIVTNTSPRFVYFRGELAAAIKSGQLLSINARLVSRVEKVLGEGGIDL